MALLLRFAGQWVAGERMEDALRVARDANACGMDALVNHLGEHYREKGPVEATTREYLGLLDAMRSQGIRGTVSLKPTQFGVLIDRAYALSQMLPVLDATKADGRVLWLDMENAHTRTIPSGSASGSWNDTIASASASRRISDARGETWTASLRTGRASDWSKEPTRSPRTSHIRAGKKSTAPTSLTSRPSSRGPETSRSAATTAG